MVETRSKKRKRQRLMSIASHVSSWPDVLARFESLNDDALGLILKFVGDKSYKSFGGLNYHCREIYSATEGIKKETFLYGYAPLSVIINKIVEGGRFNWKLHWKLREKVGKGVLFYNRLDVLDWLLQQRNNIVLSGICNAAAEEGRIDVLEEVWKDEGYKGYVFRDVNHHAARGGKLNVLKWIEKKGEYIDKWKCAKEAVEKGQLHIIQWLKEEKGLQLFGELYYFAIDGGGHFLILKWLREQACPWDDYIFKYAAVHGNLEILQWLHDEGCPWPDYVRVPEHDIKPENLTWLRVNGYGSRFM
eukprot:CAMPEP_0178952832 /NCGR_PEP_ID=MMETSP0789-20121207/8073_1 /TAXON_ID=3005 /ORGANISM="Rhizosolenia setigera, Strain CCMP 1694" /LENGTH=302 /DNA_ID=CAMNT_0020634005 /DNA_START=115 /DNA_END=1023 /DNA_ORIENTATION=-